MILGMLLLDQDDVYVRDDNTLPFRPDFDKELLIGLCKNMIPAVSNNTSANLPKSVKDVLSKDDSKYPDIALSPDKIDQLADILIITRSQEVNIGGKRFRFEKFILILELNELEIWRRV